MDYHGRHAFECEYWLADAKVLTTKITQALGELAIVYPVTGGFFPLVSRFIDPALGCALGWNCES